MGGLMWACLHRLYAPRHVRALPALALAQTPPQGTSVACYSPTMMHMNPLEGSVVVAALELLQTSRATVAVGIVALLINATF